MGRAAKATAQTPRDSNETISAAPGRITDPSPLASDADREKSTERLPQVPADLPTLFEDHEQICRNLR